MACASLSYLAATTTGAHRLQSCAPSALGPVSSRASARASRKQGTSQQQYGWCAHRQQRVLASAQQAMPGKATWSHVAVETYVM